MLSCEITPLLVEATATTVFVVLGLRAVTFNLPLTNERLLLIKFCLKLNLSTFLETFLNILSPETQHPNSLSHVFRQSFSEERTMAMTKISQRQLLF